MSTWTEVQEILASRELHRLVRSPEQTLEYRRAKERFTASHGGTAQFVISERLKWAGDDAKAVGTDFLGDIQDTKISSNDFSYDFEPDVRHFVVWSKLPIPCGSDEFPTEKATKDIENFIDTHFTEQAGVPRENSQWFKNTLASQSIPSVSHFHVLVRGCDDRSAEKILEPFN